MNSIKTWESPNHITCDECRSLETCTLLFTASTAYSLCSDCLKILIDELKEKVKKDKI